MKLLNREHYSKARAIFDGFDHQLIVSSVLDGNTRGKIYVDDMEDPKSGIIHGIGFEILISGDHSDHASLRQKLADLFIGKLIPDARKFGMTELNVYFPSESWKAALQEALSEHLALSVVKKRFYTFNLVKHALGMDARATPGLRRIDTRLLDDGSLKNRDALLQWISLSWNSTDDFARQGIGYCIVEDETIASWCLSVFASGNRMEFALFTDADYRGRGYAKRSSAACVEQSVDSGCLPIWVCNDDNLPSIHIAEAIGFRQKLDFQALQVKL